MNAVNPTPGEPLRTHALTLVGIVGRGLPQDFVRADRLTRMEELTTAHTFHAYHELITLAEGERDADANCPGRLSPCCAVPG